MSTTRRFADCFSLFDIFGLNVSLYFRENNHKRKSVIGAFMSIVLVFVALGHILMSINDKIRIDQNINFFEIEKVDE